MKKKMKYKKLLLAVSVLFFLVSVPQYGEELKERPDSINYIMGINLDSTVYEEFSGRDITEFRLYTTSVNSSIVWKSETGYFVYSLKGDSHAYRAVKLFKELQKNGLTTFIAERKGKDVKFHKYHQVVALQIVGYKN